MICICNAWWLWVGRKCHGADLGQYSVESWLTADFGWIRVGSCVMHWWLWVGQKCHGADSGRCSVESWLTADFGWIRVGSCVMHWWLWVGQNCHGADGYQCSRESWVTADGCRMDFELGRGWCGDGFGECWLGAWVHGWVQNYIRLTTVIIFFQPLELTRVG